MTYLIGEKVEVKGEPWEVWSLGRWEKGQWVPAEDSEPVPDWAMHFAFVGGEDGVWALTINPNEETHQDLVCGQL
jgi:hypothetical protein